MESKKSLILEAAYNVLIDEGIEGFSMSKIGKQAKIPKSLIFHYFENKDALILELVEYILYKNDSRAREYTNPEGNITKEGFVKYIDLLFSMDFEEKRLINAYYACFYLGARNEVIKSKLSKSIEFARNNYRKNFEMFAKEGIIKGDKITLAVDYMLSTVAGITKVADMEYGEQSINKELVAMHKKNLFEIVQFVE